MQRLIATLATLALAFGGAAARADSRTDLRLEESRKVLESFTTMEEQSVPPWLLDRAYGIVVVPNVIKAAAMIGGRGGAGVMAVRNPDGTWSNPVFVTIGGGSFGFQWGLQSTDLVLVLMSRKSVEGISGGKVTLGADASVAAGPLGRSTAAQTDATFRAQILSYSRSEGVFLGVALDGSVILVDDKSNATAYGVSDIMASQILDGRAVTAPAAAQEFTAALNRITAQAAGKEGEPVAQPSPAAPAQEAAAPPAPAAGEPATTYPMEDPQPGAPPPP